VDLDEAIASRRMTRRFADRAIAAPTLRAVIEAGLHAPSAGFAQGVDFLVLEESSALGRFWELASDRAWRERRGGSAAGLLPAPVIVVPLGDPQAYLSRYAAPDKDASSLSGTPVESWPVPYWTVDASFAAMLVLLAATNNGLGALFFRLHGDAPALLAAFGVPAGRVTIGAIALGWPAGAPPGEEVDPAAGETAGPARRPPRRGYDERVHLNLWSPSAG
jgi:nitroreductase